MRVLIVDDHPLLRHGVRQQLAMRWPGVPVFEAKCLFDAEAVVRAEALDCVILDLSLEDARGLDALVRIRRLDPALPILVLSAHSDQSFAVRALRAGAAGYLNKRCSGDELVRALESVLAGGRHLTEVLSQRLADIVARKGDVHLPHETLSRQEFRVLLHLGSGISVGAIAETMSLSAKTVSTYRRRLLDKMGLDGNANLIRYCMDHDLTRL